MQQAPTQSIFRNHTYPFLTSRNTNVIVLVVYRYQKTKLDMINRLLQITRMKRTKKQHSVLKVVLGMVNMHSSFTDNVFLTGVVSGVLRFVISPELTSAACSASISGS
jgi:hypothetical protein